MKPLIIANWKCNPTSLAEAKRLFDSVKRGVRNIKNAEVVICPPFHYLPVLNNVGLTSIKLGAQDCFWEEKGAFTGEISPKMIKNLGCQYIIIGHSERRKYFNETDEIVNKKLQAVLSARLNPILCIGETQQERKKGKTKEILKKQLKEALDHSTTQLLNHLIVAYEPIWAIGTGKACSPDEAKRASDFIRSAIAKIYNQKIAKNIRLLYGGSVNSKNAKSYIQEAGFQGLLVGGASLDQKEFIKIIKTAV